MRHIDVCLVLLILNEVKKVCMKPHATFNCHGKWCAILISRLRHLSKQGLSVLSCLCVCYQWAYADNPVDGFKHSEKKGTDTVTLPVIPRFSTNIGELNEPFFRSIMHFSQSILFYFLFWSYLWFYWPHSFDYEGKGRGRPLNVGKAQENPL